MPSYNFFKSTDIQVFPCAYRGYQGSNESDNKVFDPESRMFTEQNSIRSSYNVYGKEDSYILDYNLATGSDYLEIVIKGYYFRINNFNTYKNSGWTTLGIELKDISIAEDYSTSVLKNLTDDGELYLDQPITGNSNNYEFRGLGMYTPTGGESQTLYSLTILDSEGNILDTSKRINIRLADLNEESGHIITSADTDTGLKAITGDKEFRGNISIKEGANKTLTIEHATIIDTTNVDITVSDKLNQTGNMNINLDKDKSFKVINKASSNNEILNINVDNSNTSLIKTKSTITNILPASGNIEIKKADTTTAFKVTNTDISLGNKINTNISLYSNKKITRLMGRTSQDPSLIERDIVVPDYTEQNIDQVLAVDDNGTGLTWRVGIPDFGANEANKVLSVNANGDALEWRGPYINALADGEIEE